MTLKVLLSDGVYLNMLLDRRKLLQKQLKQASKQIAEHRRKMNRRKKLEQSTPEEQP